MIRLLPLLLLPAVVLADVPVKPTLTRYAPLWTDSPFTTKPEPIDTGRPPEENPLEDYALGGISKLKDGYYAVLINKKKPEEREVIKPGTDSDFQVVSVQWGEKNWKDTVATVRSGSHTGSVGFDDQVLAVKKTPPQQPPAQQPQPGRPVIPGLNPNNQNQPNNVRSPRPRVVRPPTPPAGNNNRGR